MDKQEAFISSTQAKVLSLSNKTLPESLGLKLDQAIREALSIAERLMNDTNNSLSDTDKLLLEGLLNDPGPERLSSACLAVGRHNISSDEIERFVKLIQSITKIFAALDGLDNAFQRIAKELGYLTKLNE